MRPLAAVLSVLVLGACGQAEPRATPTPDAEVVTDATSTLKNMVTAQEEHQRATGAFATDVAGLRELGFRHGAHLVPEVVSATATAYCLRATSGDVVYYLDTERVVLSAEPCG